jgi:hypothetical protein
MAGCLPKGDRVEGFPSFCVGEVYDSAAEPAEEVDALLAVVLPSILGGHDRVIKDLLASPEIQTVVS